MCSLESVFLEVLRFYCYESEYKLKDGEEKVTRKRLITWCFILFNFFYFSLQVPVHVSVSLHLSLVSNPFPDAPLPVQDQKEI